MNQYLKLRYCRSFLRKIHCNICQPSFKKDIYYYRTSSSRNVEVFNFNCIPLIHSYGQIREYAKKAQGKAPKGGKVRKMQLTDEEMAEVIDVEDYREQLSIVIEKLKKDYIENLSIRSAVGNIENLIVKINNEEYPLNELAVISKKNPHLIAINLTDFPEGLKPTIQAILDSGSDFNPQQEGTMIYISVPKITREHRENLAKNAKTLFTKSKEEVRSIQNSFVRDAKGRTELSEDLVFSATNQIRSMAEQCTEDLEKILKAKQKELLGDN